MTATPSRLLQEGFTGLFDRLICSDTIAKFMYDGWLANYELWVKGNGFQRRNALNPSENIYMNRLTGTQTFLFVGYYPDGAKKVRDYKDGKYYIVEQGGAPVWDGARAMPLDTEEYESIVRGSHREERLIRDSISRKNGSWYINDY